MGCFDGRPVGSLDGCALGYADGSRVGCCVGCCVGWRVGWRVGCRVGWRVGWRVGCRVGWLVGTSEFRCDGFAVGLFEGCVVGWPVGPQYRKRSSHAAWQPLPTPDMGLYAASLAGSSSSCDGSATGVHDWATSSDADRSLGAAHAVLNVLENWYVVARSGHVR